MEENKKIPSNTHRCSVLPLKTRQPLNFFRFLNQFDKSKYMVMPQIYRFYYTLFLFSRYLSKKVVYPKMVEFFYKR